MNEELLAYFERLDEKLEGIPVEQQAAVIELFGEVLTVAGEANDRTAKVEEELGKATAPAALTKEAILNEKNPDKRVALIRANPDLFDPNAEKPKAVYESKSQIMAIKNGEARRLAIAENQHLFDKDYEGGN